MELSGSDIENLVKAIVSAYPSKDDLDMMIVYGFGVDEALSKITGGNNLKKIVFNLVTKWAIPQGKIEQLIEQAYKCNSDNPELKKIYQNFCQKLKPSVFNIMGFSEDECLPIYIPEWNELYLILKQINNNQLITQVCKQTLKNSQNDLLGNCLELSNKIDLKNLKEILLNKFPKRDDNVPTILEFAERLSSEVQGKLSAQLEQWIINLATRLEIDLPTYSKPSSKNDIYKYFLLIAVIPQGKNQFELQSDLLLYNCSKDSYETNPKFLDCEKRGSIRCDLTEIKDKISDLIAICQEYLQLPYILNVELFLTYRYLGYAFDLEEVVIDKERNTAHYLGIEYPLLVSSYERFHDRKLYNEFLVRWRTKVQQKLKLNFAKLIESFQELKSEVYNNRSLDELENQWKVEKIIGLKIIGCWSKEEKVQEELFYSLVRSGIPFALWSRCNDLQNCQQDLNNLLTSQPLQNWHDLFEKVWECRQKAYKKPEKIGYHLGILSDDPQRIPSNLKPLIETGK
ncbi:MAG: effector-associated domain EAD1-containing protein [Xenococcus sp. MO_188.B8]|nr:effector-associated domain EAD1-containing protein [Xenococcus sp. MO_188.B8]